MHNPILSGLMLVLAGVALVLLVLALGAANLTGATPERANRITKFAREGLGMLAYAGLILFYMSRAPVKNDVIFLGTIVLSVIAFVGEVMNALQRLNGERASGGRFFFAAGALSVLAICLRLW